MSTLLVYLCAVGGIISLHFTAIAFHWVKADSRRLPIICRLEQQTCTAIVFTPSARILGPPNSLLGLIFYTLLGTAVATCGLHDPMVHLIGLSASAIALLFSLYLIYSLLFIVRAKCVFCFASHAINLMLFVVLLAQL
ncbi:MAG: hypothetical protein CL484_12380 [Acidobacteria bacterium]|nr:hypothetical protein [Acidobacteriota bacterium]